MASRTYLRRRNSHQERVKELEKELTETRAKLDAVQDAQHSQSLNSGYEVGALQSLRESVKEAETKHKLKMQATIQKHKEEIHALQLAMDQLKDKHLKTLKELRFKLTENATAKLKKQKDHHANELKRSKEEIEKMKANVDTILNEIKSKQQEKFNRKINSIRLQHQSDVEKIQREMKQIHEKEKKELHTLHQVEVDKKVAETKRLGALDHAKQLHELDELRLSQKELLEKYSIAERKIEKFEVQVKELKRIVAMEQAKTKKDFLAFKDGQRKLSEAEKMNQNYIAKIAELKRQEAMKIARLKEEGEKLQILNEAKVKRLSEEKREKEKRLSQKFTIAQEKIDSLDSELNKTKALARANEITLSRQPALIEKLKDAEKEKLKWKKQSEELLNKILIAEEEQKRVCRKNILLQQKLDDAEHEKVKIKNDNDKVLNKMYLAEKEREKMHEERIMSLQQKLAKLEDEKVKLKSQHIGLLKKVDDLEKEREGHQRTMISLEQHLDVLKNETMKMKLQNDEIVDKLHLDETEKVMHEKKIMALRKKNVELESQKLEMIKKHDALLNKMRVVKEQDDQMVALLQKKMDETVESLIEERKLSERNNKKATEALEKVVDLEKTRTTLQDRLKVLTNVLRATRAMNSSSELAAKDARRESAAEHMAEERTLQQLQEAEKQADEYHHALIQANMQLKLTKENTVKKDETIATQTSKISQLEQKLQASHIFQEATLAAEKMKRDALDAEIRAKNAELRAGLMSQHTKLQSEFQIRKDAHRQEIEKLYVQLNLVKGEKLILQKRLEMLGEAEFITDAAANVVDVSSIVKKHMNRIENRIQKDRLHRDKKIAKEAKYRTEILKDCVDKTRKAGREWDSKVSQLRATDTKEKFNDVALFDAKEKLLECISSNSINTKHQCIETNTSSTAL
eukprot:g6055.t1